MTISEDTNRTAIAGSAPPASEDSADPGSARPISDPRGIAGDITERLLQLAGICDGMRILDLGCGQGDVSLLAAALTGPTGEVVGIDRSEVALAIARQRASAAGLTNLRFVLADLDEMAPPEPRFDAIVGRRVLMYLPNPATTLFRLAPCLRPGGVMAFQEHDGLMVPASSVRLPLHEQVTRWVWETVEREGANRRMGFELPSVFARAGLTLEGLRAEAITSTKTSPHPIAAIVQAMLPRIVKQGVASARQIDIDSLYERLQTEREATDGVFISDVAFYGWARKASAD